MAKTHKKSDYSEDTEVGNSQALKSESKLDKSTIPSNKHKNIEQKLVNGLENQRDFMYGFI